MGRNPAAMRRGHLPSPAVVTQNAAMRVVLLIMTLLPLAACAGGPQALGITGPQGVGATSLPPQTGATEQTDPLDNPDLQQPGTRYGPSIAPSTGSGNFWGYN